jgi:hypothetical protein
MLKVKIDNARVLTKRELPELCQRLQKTPLLQLQTPLFTLTLTTSLTREWTTQAKMTQLAFSLHWLSEYSQTRGVFIAQR